MTKTMKAAVVREFGEPLTIEEVPVPTPRGGEVLMRDAAAQVITRTGGGAHGVVVAHGKEMQNPTETTGGTAGQS
jgi:Zn-dependent alcohol dehydrogenase